MFLGSEPVSRPPSSPFGALKGGAPKGGAPKGGAPKGGARMQKKKAPKGWCSEREHLSTRIGPVSAAPLFT